MKNLVLSFILTLFLSTQVYAQNLTAKANRSTVPLGETFILILEYDDILPAGQTPDWSPLDDSFVIYSVSNSYSSAYSDGVFKKAYQWNVALSPKEAGNIIIPPINLGNLKTKPIRLKVTDSLSSGSVLRDTTPQFSISRVIDNSSPTVQEQIHYKLTVSSTEVLQGKKTLFLFNNENDWIVRSLGSPKIRSEIVDGVEVNKIDFEYALFPQRSGDLTIPEVRFEGYYTGPDISIERPSLLNILTNGFLGDTGFDFDSMLPKTPVVLTAKPINVKVAKIPDINNGKWWLPAKSVRITSDWDNGIPDFISGEVVDRKIRIEAVGVIDTQMPKLEFAAAPNLKQYPEKPDFEAEVNGLDVISIMTVNNAYILNKSGPITIPAIKVDWYNTNTGKMEQAVLPEIKANVLKGLQSEEDDVVGSEPVFSAGNDEIGVVISKNYTWIYVATAFLLGIFLSYVLFKPKKVKSTNKKENKKEEIICVSKAFRGDDIKAMRDSVLAWARNFYAKDNITNLNDVAKLTNDAEFKKQLDMLSTALYSGNSCDFNAGEFLIVFDKVSKKHKKLKKKEKLLPDLYK